MHGNQGSTANEYPAPDESLHKGITQAVRSWSVRSSDKDGQRFKLGKLKMKCNELKYEKLGDMMPFYPRSTLVIRKQFVDAAIDELKDKCQMHDFFWEGCGFAKRGFKNTISVSEAFDKLEEENAELKAKLESVQASAYAESVDAGMENRRLKRALWLARAESAKNVKCRYYRLAQKEVCDQQPHGWSCYINGEVYPTGKMSRKLEPHYWCDIWDEVERKCRAKAKEYK